MTDKTNARPVPVIFWIVGIVGLVWNLLGCMNFFAQMNPEMVASMPRDYRDIIENRPIWATIAFAIAVFGGAFGAMLMLGRKSSAVYLFVFSLIGAVLTQLPVFGMADTPDAAFISGLSQLVIGVFLVWFSKHAYKKGWYRSDSSQQ